MKEKIGTNKTVLKINEKERIKVTAATVGLLAIKKITMQVCMSQLK